LPKSEQHPQLKYSNKSIQITKLSTTTMKLIIAGATGLVGSELIRQSLQMNAITQVIALARKPVQVDNLDSAKLKQVTISDYGEYSEQVRSELAGADACIWYLQTVIFISDKEYADVV
jgi:putative NADH-flavin reductase